MKKKIYDTSSLLLVGNKIFNETADIVITSITLKELERIKTAANKDATVKYAARQLLHILDENPQAYECWIYKSSMNTYLEQYDLEINDDAKILITAYDYINHHPDDDYIFYTNDLALKKIATLFFKDKIDSVKDVDDYSGYKDLYSNPIEYGKQFYINEYVNIYNQNKERVDTLCWDGITFRPLKYKNFTSKQIGEVRPYKDDICQTMAFDSLLNNKITLIKGPAGSGKSLLAIGFLFSMLERNKIDKIIIFCNTVATKNAARLGFYPG